MKNLIHQVCLCVFSLLLSVNIFALDGVRIAVGSGEGSTDTYDISLLKYFDKTWFDGALKGHWALTFSHWDAHKGPVDDLQALSVAPVFVYEFKKFSAGIRPYIDYSLGLVYISETKIAGNNLGMHMQFDNRLDLGARFGPDERHDLSVSFRHVSNAGIDEHNQGFESSSVAYTYHF